MNRAPQAPAVTCAGGPCGKRPCRHFRPWPDNPTAAMGRCKHPTRVASIREPLPWPNVPRFCNEYQPEEADA